MIVPIGTRVVIKDSPMLIPRCLAGQEATVTGYEHNPPTVISRHHLEIDGDVTFKYPTLFSWEFQIADDLPPCSCGMGDASMPQLHDETCAINLALTKTKSAQPRWGEDHDEVS